MDNLPPLRKSRPNSSIEKTKWNKFLTAQRRMSLDNMSETSKYEKCEKNEKLCPRLVRVLKQPHKEVIVKKAEKVPRVIRVLKSDKYSDDPLILEGMFLLESLNSISYSNLSINIYDDKIKLKRLLFCKIKCITQHDCLQLIQDAIHFVRELESLYADDLYKFETAKNVNNLLDKDRKKAIENFILSLKKRQNLIDETEKKINDWNSTWNNVNRLMNLIYPNPNERSIRIMIERTLKEMDKIKASIIYWISLVLTINLKIITLYWEQISYDSLSNILSACNKFNYLFSSYLPSKSIKVIQIIAENQAKISSSRMSFLIQTEMKKIASSKKKLLIRSKSIIRLKDDTSDNDCGENSEHYKINNYKDSYGIHLCDYLSMVISSNQRVVLKLSFGAQNLFTSTTNKKSNWITFEKTSSHHPKIFHLCDHIYWIHFWSFFSKTLISEIIYFRDKTNCLPLILNPEEYSLLMKYSFEDVINENDLPPEALIQLNNIRKESLYHFIDSKWLQGCVEIERGVKERIKEFFRSDGDIEQVLVPNIFNCLDNLLYFIDFVNTVSDLRLQYSLLMLKKIILNLNLLLKKSEFNSNKLLIVFFERIQTFQRNLNHLNTKIAEEKIHQFNEYLDNIRNNVIEKMKKMTYTHLIFSIEKKIFSLPVSKSVITQPETNSSKQLVNLILDPYFRAFFKITPEVSLIRLKEELLDCYAKGLIDLTVKHSKFKQKLRKKCRYIIIQQMNEFLRYLNEYIQINYSSPAIELIKIYLKNNNTQCGFFRSNKIDPLNEINESYSNSKLIPINIFCKCFYLK